MMLQFIRSLFSGRAPKEAALVVDEIRRLDLKPGDILIIKAPRPISDAAAQCLRQQLDKVVPGHKALVLDRGYSIEAIRPAETAHHVH